MSTPNTKTYDLEKTAIEKGGVFRCCAATVAAEYEGKQVEIGAKSACSICKESFTLIMVPEGMSTCYVRKVADVTPIWKPDSQIEEWEKKHPR